MFDPFKEKFLALGSAQDEIWRQLVRGVADRRHGFHQVAVATLGLDGMPRSRIAILRGADHATCTIRFHTDQRSAKIAELEADPRCSILAYATDLKLQARLEGRAVLHRNNETARRFWDLSQRMSRKCYGTQPAPGSDILDGNAFALPEDDDAIAQGYENFVAVTLQVKRLEWLYLRHEGHLRAMHELPDGTAKWLVP
jgi:pyridoxamine 5'-phosphate oxidase